MARMPVSMMPIRGLIVAATLDDSLVSQTAHSAPRRIRKE
jgi:hypothetical protein